MKKAAVCGSVICCLLVAQSASADDMTGQLEDEFSVTLVYLSLKTDQGKPCEICIAGTRDKKTKKLGIAVALAGPNKSCPGEVKDYNEPNSWKKWGISASAAKFEGDPFHPGELDGEYWLYKSILDCALGVGEFLHRIA